MEEDDYEVSFPAAKTMKITGSDQSCRWALNRLLENWGAVFCFPCEGGTHWPRTNRLAVARTPFSGTKAFKLTRDLYAEDPEWERSLSCKHRTGENFFNHNMYKVFPLDKYGKEPWVNEVMPEIKGARKKPTSPYSGWQPCYSSETCVAEAVKNICAFLDRHPAHKTFSLSVNDLEGYCECEGCKALNGGTFETHCVFGKSFRCHSESYYTWVNRVVKGVRKRHPGVYFGLLAYCGTIDPPSFPLDDHVVPFLCVETHQAQDEKVFSDRVKLLEAWSAKAKSVGFWDYAYGCRAYQVPRVYPSVQAKMFGLKSRFPFMNAFFMEGESFIGEGPKRYLYAKLIAEPNCDAEAELDRWYRACCGEAAAADLRFYYDIWERFYDSKAIHQTLWYKGLGNVYLNAAEQNYLFALPRKALDEATRRMARVRAAAEASGDEGQKFRAARLEEFHRLYVARAIAGGCGLARPDATFGDVQEAAAFVAALPEIDAADAEKNRLVDIIAERREREPRTDGRIKGHCVNMRRESRKNPNRAWLFNALLDYVDDPLVRAAMAKTAKDPKATPQLRETLASLADLGSRPNDAYPNGQDPEKDFRLWKIRDNGIAPKDLGRAANGSPRTALVNEKGGWPAAVKVIPELRPECDYVYRLRLENPTKKEIKVRMMFSIARPGGDYPPTGNGTERNFVLKPGETLTPALFGHAHKVRGSDRKTLVNPAARLYLILTGLPKNEQVIFDSYELKPLCSAARDEN